VVDQHAGPRRSHPRRNRAGAHGSHLQPLGAERAVALYGGTRGGARRRAGEPGHHAPPPRRRLDAPPSAARRGAGQGAAGRRGAARRLAEPGGRYARPVTVRAAGPRPGLARGVSAHRRAGPRAQREGHPLAPSRTAPDQCAPARTGSRRGGLRARRARCPARRPRHPLWSAALRGRPSDRSRRGGASRTGGGPASLPLRPGGTCRARLAGGGGRLQRPPGFPARGPDDRG
jgi:hypothetical protein